jgi:imidazolonepropionase-like amidohydrolase
MRRWIIRLLLAAGIVVLLAVVAIWVLQIYPLRVAHPPLQLPTGVLVIQHARVYRSPNEPPIEDAAVLIRNGRITAVGSNIQIPAGATFLSCDHCVVMAGFWNAHVHFTEPKWSQSEWKSAATLNAQLADMLTSRGFTSVVDTGSNLGDTLPLRRRIESGELQGPFIYTAGGGLYPPHGIPFYLRESLPRWILPLLSQPETPAQAINELQRNLHAGADITKLFTGSYVERGRVLPMPLDIATAAVQRTHQEGRLVFSHPSDFAGSKVAVDSGVDVLAHAPDSPDGIDAAFLQNMVQHHMSMIPTLKMFATTVTKSPSYLDPIYAEVRQFHQAGGQLIFGTDVGYMRDYTTDDEFAALAKCGLNSSDVLAMLTTNPAMRFGVSTEKGTVTPGKLADLTVLDQDPAANNLSAFAHVRMTIRSGRIIYQRK